MIKTIAHAGGLLLLALVAACASTRVTSDWKDESYQGKPGNVLVLALLNDATQRRLLEDELINEFKEQGTNAIPGYSVFPEGKPDKQAITAKVRELGVDSLFLTRLLDRKTVQEYVPGTAYFPPSAYYDWYGYYGSAYTGYPRGYPPFHAVPLPPGYVQPYPPAYSPGYTVTNVYDIAEANLYDAAAEKLIWSARTESRIQGNDRKEVQSYASQIVKALRKQNLLR